MWYLVCWHCGERVPVDNDETLNEFADTHVPHLGEDEYIEVFNDADLN